MWQLQVNTSPQQAYTVMVHIYIYLYFWSPEDRICRSKSLYICYIVHLSGMSYSQTAFSPSSVPSQTLILSKGSATLWFHHDSGLEESLNTTGSKAKRLSYAMSELNVQHCATKRLFQMNVSSRFTFVPKISNNKQDAHLKWRVPKN